MFSARRNHNNKNPVFLLSSHTTAQEEVQGSYGGNPQIKQKSHPTTSL
jgi:hypothetical protein